MPCQPDGAAPGRRSVCSPKCRAKRHRQRRYTQTKELHRLLLDARRALDRNGITKRDLTAKVGVKGAYIAQLETGARKNPSLDVLKRLARALGVPVTELLE
jgi:transcriptional regulator with XRE-family HTH domain